MVHLSDAERPGWHLSVYPDALEAGGYFRASIQRDRSYVAAGNAADPERAAAEAGRRARAKLRRYCAANRLNRLGTLTYAGAGCHDPVQLRSDVHVFFRTLRSGLGGKPLPYAWVPEWHKSGHGLHVHFAVGRYVRRSLVESAWGHGFVHVKLLGGLGHGATSVDEARIAAGYLSKYVGKTFTDPHLRDLGRHRYDVAQGFQPTKVRLYDRQPDALIAQASQMLDAPLSHLWRSEGEAGWEGPPAIWAQWGGR